MIRQIEITKFRKVRYTIEYGEGDDPLQYALDLRNKYFIGADVFFISDVDNILTFVIEFETRRERIL